ncbi:Uncharacterized phage-encoded protein [Bacteroides heparinolyticus]|uniref:Uncharacterized phage-encoded protein n=1 Tax=Prevotella heparinolytica TaxID=28113 RepID=A0A449I4J8_9BACE|nr:phage antirepressor KilAC domain-containing protein [Bacteroides heparinolyticus]VFB14393.1 Uncharacterized phage-encoded protein [Bacteroides heparinolyticus]
MQKTLVYNYKGSEISFMSGENTMINATEMAKVFGKRPNDYLSLPSTNQLISAITRKSGIAENQLVITERGGLNPGTWMHEDIALDFAQWLSVDFRLWCNDRIKELLKHGITATPQTIESILADPANGIKLLQALQEEREEKARLAMANQSLQAEKQKIEEETRPAVIFTTTVQCAKTSILVGELAKLITQSGRPIGQNRLFKWLRDNGYLGKKGSNYNVPMQKYVEMGLFEIKEGTRSGNDGVMHITKTPKVTGKGQVYFVNKFVA